MRNLKDAKQIYDQIIVPEELELMVEKTLEETIMKTKKTNPIMKFIKWATTAAAALLLCFTVGLNTSESFAMGMAELPIIGTVAKVLTVRPYHTVEDDTVTDVEVPEVIVDNASEDVENAIIDVNAEIQSIVDEFTAQKQQEIDEYKEAFLSTGGTDEEWAENEPAINVGYEVKYQSESKLSLLLEGYMTLYSSSDERHFYNLDLVTGEELTLTDLLGEDAYTYAADCVKAQMKERAAADDTLTYWGVTDENDGMEFIGVTEETPFYLNEAGNVVISYNKYDVAPGFMGIQEFEIPAK